MDALLLLFSPSVILPKHLVLGYIIFVPMWKDLWPNWGEIGGSERYLVSPSRHPSKSIIIRHSISTIFMSSFQLSVLLTGTLKLIHTRGKGGMCSWVEKSIFLILSLQVLLLCFYLPSRSLSVWMRGYYRVLNLFL